MQNNTIKNLSLALAICLGSAAGFSMDKHANPCIDESRPQKPVWGAKITSDQTSAFHHGVKLTVSKCGKTIDIAGDSDCIGVKEKKSAVQALQLALIMQGLNNQLTHSYVGELITG